MAQEEERKFSLEYYRRKLKANKMRRLVSSKRRQIRFLRVIIRLFLIAFFVYIGIYILKMPSWHISHVKLMNNDPSVLTIIGNEITPTYRIFDMLKQSELKDVGIYRLNTKNLEENISKLEPIKNVYIRRFWLPARLLIAIEEREPKFLIYSDLDSEPISIVTNDGVFIGKEYMSSNKKYHATKIISQSTQDENSYAWDKQKVDKIDKAIKIIEAYSNQKVQYLDIRNQRDIYIQLEDVLLRIGAIDDTIEKRLEFLVTVMPQLPDFKKRIKYIDLRWVENCYIKLNVNQNSSE